MRTQKALRNMLTSLISYGLLIIFGVIIRKIFLQTFNTEVTGYEGIVTDMFSYIALADFGLDNLFNYRLYEAFAKGDKNRLNKLASMYKALWSVLGIIVFIACVVLYFLLPSIFANKINNWPYFRLIFVLYSLSSICTYFFGYWRSILTASQNEYKAINIETASNFLSFIIRIAVLLITKSFVLYFVVNIGFTILSKIIVFLMSKKQLKVVKTNSSSLKDFRNEGLIDECKQLIAIKVADVVNWSSTNLFITLLINVSTATLFYNYAMIGSAVWSAISKFSKPMRATLADMVYKEDKQVSFEFFKTMDLACFFVASIIFVCYSVVFQPFIATIYGEQYLLSNYVVYAYGLLYYFAAKSLTTDCFRDCFGEYKTESKYAIFAIVITLLISIIFANKIGVIAIILSIVISCLMIWYSRTLIVIKKFYQLSLAKFWFDEFKKLMLVIIELIIAIIITKNITYSWHGIILCGIIGVIVPTLINIVLFAKTKRFKSIINIFLGIVNNRLKGATHE